MLIRSNKGFRLQLGLREIHLFLEVNLKIKLASYFSNIHLHIYQRRIFTLSILREVPRDQTPWLSSSNSSWVTSITSEGSLTQSTGSRWAYITLRHCRKSCQLEAWARAPLGNREARSSKCPLLRMRYFRKTSEESQSRSLGRGTGRMSLLKALLSNYSKCKMIE